MFNMGNMMGAVPTVMMDSGRNNDNGWGDGWWAWILMFALCGGWGNGFGWGGNGGSGGFINGDIQRGFDTQAILSKLDGISNGICSLGYDQLSQMNGINQNIMQTGFGLQRDIQANAVANMQSTNALSALIERCCCDQREAAAQARYDSATNTCTITTAINNATRDIMESNCQNYRDLAAMIQNGFTNLTIAQKDQLIAELQAKLNGCDRDNALQRIAQYIIDSIRPTPTPSWSVPNPYNQCGFTQAANSVQIIQALQSILNGGCPQC